MSWIALVVIGLLLGFAGARSLRLTVLVAGFGLSWQLAAVFGASVATTLLVSVVGGLAALVLAIIVNRAALFVVGAVVGAVVAARLFALLAGSEASWALAALFIPSLALVAGYLAQRWRRRFLRWATAVAGAGLVLAGAGTLIRGGGELFYRPEGATQSTLHVVAWVALSIAGALAQRDRARDQD